MPGDQRSEGSAVIDRRYRLYGVAATGRTLHQVVSYELAS